MTKIYFCKDKDNNKYVKKKFKNNGIYWYFTQYDSEKKIKNLENNYPKINNYFNLFLKSGEEKPVLFYEKAAYDLRYIRKLELPKIKGLIIGLAILIKNNLCLMDIKPENILYFSDKKKIKFSDINIFDKNFSNQKKELEIYQYTFDDNYLPENYKEKNLRKTFFELLDRYNYHNQEVESEIENTKKELLIPISIYSLNKTIYEITDHKLITEEFYKNKKQYNIENLIIRYNEKVGVKHKIEPEDYSPAFKPRSLQLVRGKASQASRESQKTLIPKRPAPPPPSPESITPKSITPFKPRKLNLVNSRSGKPEIEEIIFFDVKYKKFPGHENNFYPVNEFKEKRYKKNFFTFKIEDEEFILTFNKPDQSLVGGSSSRNECSSIQILDNCIKKITIKNIEIKQKEKKFEYIEKNEYVWEEGIAPTQNNNEDYSELGGFGELGKNESKVNDESKTSELEGFGGQVFVGGSNTPRTNKKEFKFKKTDTPTNTPTDTPTEHNLIFEYKDYKLNIIHEFQDYFEIKDFIQNMIPARFHITIFKEKWQKKLLTKLDECEDYTKIYNLITDRNKKIVEPQFIEIPEDFDSNVYIHKISIYVEQELLKEGRGLLKETGKLNNTNRENPVYNCSRHNADLNHLSPCDRFKDNFDKPEKSIENMINPDPDLIRRRLRNLAKIVVELNEKQPIPAQIQSTSTITNEPTAEQNNLSFYALHINDKKYILERIKNKEYIFKTLFESEKIKFLIDENGTLQLSLLETSSLETSSKGGFMKNKSKRLNTYKRLNTNKKSKRLNGHKKSKRFNSNKKSKILNSHKRFNSNKKSKKLNGHKKSKRLNTYKRFNSNKKNKIQKAGSSNNYKNDFKKQISEIEKINIEKTIYEITKGEYKFVYKEEKLIYYTNENNKLSFNFDLSKDNVIKIFTEEVIPYSEGEDFIINLWEYEHLYKFFEKKIITSLKSSNEEIIAKNLNYGTNELSKRVSEIFINNSYLEVEKPKIFIKLKNIESTDITNTTETVKFYKRIQIIDKPLKDYKPLIKDLEAIFFDFDQTLVNQHCHSKPSIPKEIAWHKKENFNGGKIIYHETEDLEYLRKLLEFLKDKKIKIYIVSRGYVNLSNLVPDFIYNVLKYGKLLNYFDGIYGCLSKEQQKFTLPLKSEKIGSEIGSEQWAQIKSMIIENVIKNNNFNRKRVLFVDDTPLNLGYASINNHIITSPIQATDPNLKGIDMLKEGVFGENFNENSTIVSNNYYNYPEGEKYKINLDTHNIINLDTDNIINITHLNKIMELQNNRLEKEKEELELEKEKESEL